MTSLASIVLVVAGSLLFGRKAPGRQGIAILLAIASALPLLDGGMLLVFETGRLEDGRVTAGVVTERLSSTGADGSRTIGARRESGRPPAVKTIVGFRVDDVLARMMMSGSPDAWVIDYRYACGTPVCWKRDFVSRELWSTLRPGQTVNVRIARGLRDGGRLDENTMWGVALAKVAIGGTGVLIAAIVSGRWPRRRRRLLTAPAIVTAVDAVSGSGWRVRFCYVAADGTARESADEIYVPGLEPGDTCTAVYPPERPELGSLRL